MIFFGPPLIGTIVLQLSTAWVAHGTPSEARPSTGATGPVFIRPLVPDSTPKVPRRIVFAFMPALTFGLAPVPSLDLPLFLGGRLRGRPWALGYQLTWSGGGAERYLGFWVHRHHVTATRIFGSAGRGLITAGGGVALIVLSPIIEAEVRVAWRFGKRRRGLLGLVSRLGWNVGFGELAPLPQLGLVLGMSTL